MKKTHILTLLLTLTVSVAFGQTPYKLNYPDITIGNSPTGKIVLNGSNLRLPRIADGSLTDSVLTIVSGVIKKVPRSQFSGGGGGSYTAGYGLNLTGTEFKVDTTLITTKLRSDSSANYASIHNFSDANFVHSGIPLIPSSGEPFVVKDGNTYIMYSFKFVSPNVITNISTSNNLTGPYNEVGSNILGNNYHKFVLLVDVNGDPVKINGKYHGYASLYQGAFLGKKIDHFESISLTTGWTLTGTAIPIGLQGSFDTNSSDTPCAVYENGFIYMFYMGMPQSNQPVYGLAHRQLLAKSSNPANGFTYVKEILTPAINVNKFDYGWIGGAQVKKINGKYQMIYNASSKRPDIAGDEPAPSSVGYATAGSIDGEYIKSESSPLLFPDFNSLIEIANIWRPFLFLDKRVNKWFAFYNTGIAGLETITFAYDGTFKDANRNKAIAGATVFGNWDLKSDKTTAFGQSGNFVVRGITENSPTTDTIHNVINVVDPIKSSGLTIISSGSINNDFRFRITKEGINGNWNDIFNSGSAINQQASTGTNFFNLPTVIGSTSNPRDLTVVHGNGGGFMVRYFGSNDNIFIDGSNIQARGGANITDSKVLKLNPIAGNILLGTSVENSSGAKVQVNGGVNVSDLTGTGDRAVFAAPDGTLKIGASSSYTLPIASSTVLGGIKVGAGLSIDGTGVLSTTGGSQTLQQVLTAGATATIEPVVQKSGSNIMLGLAGSGAANGFTVRGTGRDWYHFVQTNGNYTFGANQGDKYYFTNDGKFGINQSTPAVALDVVGVARVSTAPTASTDVVRKTELDLKANLASPTFTGTPLAPSPSTTTITANQIATTNFTGIRINFTTSGTGSATTISVPHGLTGVTASSFAIAQAKNAASSGISYVTTDATNINIVYSVAPAAGTNNLYYSIEIRP